MLRTIRLGNISALGSDIYGNHSIVYTSTCNEEEIIWGTLSNNCINDGSNSISWNDENFDFDYQFHQMSVDKLFHTSDELIIR